MPPLAVDRNPVACDAAKIYERERYELDALKAPPYHPNTDLIGGLSKRSEKRLRNTYTPVRDLRNDERPAG